MIGNRFHGRGLTRRRLLALSALGGVGLVAACAPTRPTQQGGGVPPTDQPPSSVAPAGADLDKLAQNIVSGGPAKDGIPPIDQPQFLTAAEMDRLLEPGDAVFVLEYKGQPRVYPQIVLVWHEIVNDEVAGEKLSVTYCPLTGSAVAFKGRAPDGSPLTFGTSGKLVNSNLLMYDRQTDSQWPQILGQAITGPMKGAALEEIPLVWTTWQRWKDRGVDAPVLSTRTGHVRSYGSDPYGSYVGPNQGYYGSPELFFPVPSRDDRLPTKEVVVGVKTGHSHVAVPRGVALQKGVWNLELAGSPLVAVRDPDLETVWVFGRRLGDEVLELRAGDKGELLDQKDRVWRREGLTLKGPGNGGLAAAAFYDVMWFAWSAFFPGTALAA